MDERLRALQGDITKIEVDAIVNAANNSLLGGGGVDGAIHRAGGPDILDQCRAIRRKQGLCQTGEAVLTGAGRLPAKFVIHTVGPIWQGGEKGEEALLARCYEASLERAVEHQCATIAFPNISTGAFGYPKEAAAAVAVRALRRFLATDASIREILMVCFEEASLQCIETALRDSSP